MDNNETAETQDVLEIQAQKNEVMPNQTQEDIQKIEKTYQNILNDRQEIEQLKNEIEVQHNLICVDDDEGDSLSTEIKNARDEANKLTEEIKNTRDEADKELTEIQNLKQESQENNDAIQSTIQDLQSFYYKVFGKEDESGNKIEGIEDKIEKNKKETEITLAQLQEKFEKFCEDKESKLEEYYKKAKETFEIARSGGLSKTFFEQAQEQKKSIKTWDIIFAISLGIITVITVAMVFVLGTERLLDISAFFVRIVFVLPFVWLAIYASQRRAEAQRLAQEYTHKATTLQTYLLHKDEIQKLQQSDDELMNKLINSNIDTVAFNPSSSLDKVNKDKDYKNLIKDTKEIIKDTKEIIQEFQTPKPQQGGGTT